MNRRLTAAAMAVLALAITPAIGAAAAEATGPNEFSGSLSYNDIEDTTLTAAAVSYGRYLTEWHEIGVTASYLELDVDDVGSLDGTTIGAFYHLNIPTEGIVTPYVGLNVASISGDLGDAYDMSYGVAAGMKVYPFENGGFIVSVAYQELQGAEDFIEDANGTSVNVGILLRF